MEANTFIELINMKKNVGILLFDQVEALDFAGPFEVFSVASELHQYELFNVFTVAKTPKAISAINGLSINPTYGIQTVPFINILVIPGGEGTKSLMNDQRVMDWLRRIQSTVEITMSVCSGARILGKLGWLDGKTYCTHHEVYNDMKEIVPTGKPVKDKRFTGDGHIYSSAGIAAGIDLALHLVKEINGEVVAQKTMKYMEYRA
jgi:transcriptional regulator GlxA family with amidase domain